MMREGPDGTLWVADMYRYMIEHPDWLPKEGKAELLPHYREGDDRGRIYRVSRRATPAFRAPRFDQLNTAQLVAALDTSNGWQRDKIQQLLLWRADKTAAPALRELARTNAHPLTRLHALCTLDGLGELEPAAVTRALADGHPGVRENALRLAETRFTPEVLAAAVRLAGDADAKVRLQLAFSLGAATNALAGETLARLLTANAAEPMLVAAVMSSTIPHLRPLITAASRAEAGGSGALIEPLLTIALGVNDRDALAQLLAPTLTPAAAGARHTPAQLAAFTRLLDQLAQRNTTLEKLREIPPRPTTPLRACSSTPASSRPRRARPRPTPTRPPRTASPPPACSVAIPPRAARP